MKKRTLMLAVASVFFASLIPAVQAQDAAPFVGTWNGTVFLPGMELDFTMKISLNEEKKLIGTIDVPDQDAMDLPLANFEIEGKWITFIIDHPTVLGDPTFVGELDDTGKKITGTYTQSGGELDFIAEKE